MRTILLLLALLPTAALGGAVEHFEAGDFDLAVQAAEKDLAREPKRLDALIILGRAHLAADRPAEAVAALRRAAAVEPPSAEAHYRLGQALTIQISQSGVWRKVLLSDDIGAAFERAVELAPDDSEYRYALFEFYRHAPSFVGGGMVKARKQAAALAKLDPARGHRANAALLLQEGRVGEAEAQLRAAIAAAPDVADHRYALGYFQQNQKRWSAAFGTFDQILERFPAEKQALFQIGKTAAVSGQQVDAGIRALQRYVKHKPKADEPPLSWAQYRLGQLLERQKKPDEAAGAYRRALELDPRLSDARQALRALGGS
jgi:tetratricopeptide (TPR) repeat protein